MNFPSFAHLMINRFENKKMLRRLSLTAFVIMTTANAMLAQLPSRPTPQSSQSSTVVQEDYTLNYLLLLVLVIGLACAIGYWYKKRNAAKNSKGIKEGDMSGGEGDALDFDKEMEWFKNAAKKKRANAKKEAKISPEKRAIQKKKSNRESRDRRLAQEKRAFQRLPITKIKSLKRARPYEELEVSNDEGLLNAIEQAHDEFEEDEMVRGLAVRVLARFKTKNSIDALADIAQYDVSAHIRSEAVTALAEFDHESVFEPLLLACADPTREVRAAAARALFRLSFDRADAWARLALANDNFRTVRAAKAAIESELVGRSIVRLIHEDERYAYEAFALVALLIEAGETREIFDVIENQSDKNVKFAMLHCLKAVKNPNTLDALYNYVERNSLPEDLSNAVNDVIRSFVKATV